MRIKDFLSYIYRHTNWFILRAWNFLFAQKRTDFDSKKTPIIINNYNRVSSLKMQLEAFEKRGYTNIYIIDNASTYPPLLEFYNHCKYPVFRLKKNIGFLALWETGICKKFRNKYYVYTDSDIIPNENLPENFLDYFYDLMDKYDASKVGFALAIDDIPTCNILRKQIQDWEEKYWINALEKDVYAAEIDTTFALYRPNVKRYTDRFGQYIRVGGAYTAKHLPWYNDSNNLSEEEQYYLNQCRQSKTSSHWTSALIKKQEL